jgi:flagellar protein FlgJ
MDISPLQPQVKPSQIPFEKLAKNPNVSDADKVKEAAKQFEAILLRQILGEARKSVIKADDDDDSNTQGIYNDMVTTQLADSISHSGAFGLAKSLVTQLSHQILPKGEGAALKTAPPVSPVNQNK